MSKRVVAEGCGSQLMEETDHMDKLSSHDRRAHREGERAAEESDELHICVKFSFLVQGVHCEGVTDVPHGGHHRHVPT